MSKHLKDQPLEIADIKLPSDPSWWPPAIGWWILLLICLVILVWLLNKAYKFIQRCKKHSAFKKSIESEFSEIETVLNQSVNGKNIAKANQLLRRLSIFIANNEKAKDLTGDAWLKHLDGLSNSTAYTKGIGQIFSAFPYMQEQKIAQQNLSSKAINKLLKKTMDQTLRAKLSLESKKND